MAGRANRGKLAGVGALYAAGVASTVWVSHWLDIGSLLLLPLVLALSWVAARWAWGAEWTSQVGVRQRPQWIATALLAALLCGLGCLIIGAPHLHVVDLDAVLAAAATATAEEVAWRGVLLGLLLGIVPRPVAIVVSSMAFGVAHFVHALRGAAVPEVALRVAVATGLGFALCALRLRSGLGIAILAHALWNTWARAGDPVIRTAFPPGPSGALWASAAIAAGSTLFLFRRGPRPHVAAVLLCLTAAATWNAWGLIEGVRERRAALERCADWGVNDLEDFSPIGRPGRWHWAPSARETPAPVPESELDMLQQRESIDYLRHVATKDPEGRMRVAATGLLVRMVDECVPRWIVEGQYADACWSLLEAHQVLQTGGAKAGPDGHGLNTLLRTVVGRDPETGRAMVAALIAAMDRADMWSALCFANTIRQSHLDLTGFRERLLSCMREGSDAGAVGSASVLAYMGEVESRALVEATLDRWAAQQSQAQDAVRHLRKIKMPADPPQATVTSTRDWERFRSRLAEIEGDWVFERTSLVALRPFKTQVLARGLFWRAGADRLSATATEFEDTDDAQLMFAREASIAVARESRIDGEAGETAVFASGSRDMVMILARRGAVYYQVNGRRSDAQRLHEHIERFLQAGEDSTK